MEWAARADHVESRSRDRIARLRFVSPGALTAGLNDESGARTGRVDGGWGSLRQ